MDLFEMYPFLYFLLLIWLIASVAKKAKGKQQGKTGAGRSAAGSRPAAPEKPAVSGGGMDGRLLKEFPQLKGKLQAMLSVPQDGGAQAPAAAPARPAEARTAPSGSLSASVPEGTDPCHDDPRAVPTGSLRVSVPEGTDPCHDGMYVPAEAAQPQVVPRAARPERAEGAEAPAGLDLEWTGSDIVKGFVYGEILRRKTG